MLLLYPNEAVIGPYSSFPKNIIQKKEKEKRCLNNAIYI